MSGINLKGFCFVQEEIWISYTNRLQKEVKCKECKQTKLKMISKWICICENCKTKFKIKKPKNFPKNMDNKRNWKATCDECSGTMDYYENSHNMAYICKKCGNILEV